MAPEIEVVTDAIRADAELWDQQTAPTQRAASTIQPLNLGAIDVPLTVLVKDAINDIVPLLHALASDADREFGQVASDLQLNAQAYENNEADAIAHIASAYWYWLKDFTMNNLQRLLDALEKTITQVEQFLATLQSIWSQARAALGVAFIALQYLVDIAIRALRAAAETALRKTRKHLEQGFEIVQIFTAQGVWRDEVVAPFTQISTDLTDLETKKGAWSGEACDSYSSLTANQGGATSKLSTAASSIASSLVTTGVGLIIFCAGAVGATVTVVVGLTAAGAATTTGVRAPTGATVAGLTALQWAAVVVSLIATSATLAGI